MKVSLFMAHSQTVTALANVFLRLGSNRTCGLMRRYECGRREYAAANALVVVVVDFSKLCVKWVELCWLIKVAEMEDDDME